MKCSNCNNLNAQEVNFLGQKMILCPTCFNAYLLSLRSTGDNTAKAGLIINYGEDFMNRPFDTLDELVHIFPQLKQLAELLPEIKLLLKQTKRDID